MLKFIGTYLLYSDVFKDKPPTLGEIGLFFQKYDKKQLVQLLSKLNIVVWKEQMNEDVQKKLIEKLFNEEDQKEVKDILEKRKKELSELSTVIHRHQMLLAIKILLLSKESTENLPVSNLKDFGRYLLAINEYLTPLENPWQKILMAVKFEETRKAMARLGYFSHQGIIRNSFPRAIQLWLKIPQSPIGKKIKEKFNIDIYSEFQDETGLSIEDFISINLSMLAKLFELNVATEKPEDFMLFGDYFSLTNLDEKTKKLLLKTVRQNISDFPKNYQDSINIKLKSSDLSSSELEINNFLPLVEYPILEINDGLSIIADPQFLEERITTGPYWILLNRYVRLGEIKTGKGRLLSAYYGQLHQEYVREMLENVCDEVIEVPETDDKMCDFIGVINYKDEIYLTFIDAKKIALTLPTVLRSGRKETIQDMKKIFQEHGFPQVYSTIQKFLSDELPVEAVRKIDKTKIKMIFPLLLTDRFIPDETSCRALYEKEFFSPLLKEYPIQDNRLAAPMFISSEEMEMIEANVLDKKNTALFPAILLKRNDALGDAYYLEERQFIPGMRFEDIGWVVKNLDIFWNFLFINGFNRIPNQRLQKIFDEAFQKVKQRLFGKTT